MLAIKKSAGVTPEVNLKNLLHAGEEARKQGIHPGFENQGRCHQKSKTGVSVAPQKGLVSSKKIFFKKLSDIRELTCCDAPDDDDLHRGTFVYVTVHSMETCIELQNSQTQTCTDSKHGTDNGQDVYYISYESIDSVTCYRKEVYENRGWSIYCRMWFFTISKSDRFVRSDRHKMQCLRIITV